jgi:hypothetical protein
MDAVHRILTGQTRTRWQLALAGAVALAWIGMDAHQYWYFLFDAPQASCAGAVSPALPGIGAR